MSIFSAPTKSHPAQTLKDKLGDSMMLFGLGITVFYWFFDAFLRFWTINHQNEIRTIFIGTEFDFYQKVFVSTLFIVFGSHVKESLVKRQQAEDKLKDSEEKYRSMMMAMKDSAYICSQDYKIEYFNPAMKERVHNVAIGQLCYKTIYGRSETCPWCVMDKIHDKAYVEYELSDAEKETFFSITNSPIEHTDGSVSKLTIFRDISKVKLYEKRLQQAQKLETIGTLAGGIAHDFNNILMPIIGYTEILRMEVSEDSPAQKSIDQVYKGAMRARELVQQILTFARQDDAYLQPMKIQPFIKEALRLIRSSVPKHIDIERDIDADCGMVMADPTQVHQIIMNLVTNASHAMGNNKGKITVSLAEGQLEKEDLNDSEMKPGAYTCLRVSDQGQGMEQEVMDKIFDPFFTTKEKGKGTGMGLSMVHGIVKTMGGDVQVTSEPGKGSEFLIYWPTVNQDL